MAFFFLLSEDIKTPLHILLRKTGQAAYLTSTPSIKRAYLGCIKKQSHL
jgi:hypothetical protein